METLKIEDVVNNTKVYGLNESIKRAKYPMSVDISLLDDTLTKGILNLGNSSKGEGHDQFLTGIVVQFDLTFSNKAWVEMERYHFINFVSSQSTMHRITSMNLDEQYISYVDKRAVEIMKEKVQDYNNFVSELSAGFIPQSQEIIEKLEEEKRTKYLEILYTNPCGMQLTAGMTTNYRQLKTIYSQRKNHRLPEWRVFCKWIEALPKFKELCLGGN